MIEVCHGIERVPQPQPARNPGGDCFACAATAGLRFLFPEREISLDDVWEMFVVEYYDGSAQKNLRKLRGAVKSYLDAIEQRPIAELVRTYDEVSIEKPKTTVCNDWYGFRTVLEKVSHEWGRIEIEWDMVEPRFDSNGGHPHWSYPWRYQDCGLGYARRLEGWLRGGWVAFTEIRLDGGGPFDPGYQVEGGRHTVGLRGIDHFIVVDGVRHRYVETRDEETGAFKHGTWVDEIHVVDSSTRNITGWYETAPFTRAHGASSWWLARRDTR